MQRAAFRDNVLYWLLEASRANRELIQSSHAVDDPAVALPSGFRDTRLHA